MLDADLAELYGVSTSRLNEQVKRNKERFPIDFMFQITEQESEYLKLQKCSSEEFHFLSSQNAILKEGRGKHRKYLPYVFTEQGVAGLSGVLKSETATRVHVALMRAFVAMRKLLAHQSGLWQRLEQVEYKQVEADQKFEQIFQALEQRETIPAQGIFFDGQVFDAYELTSKIIRSATKSIVLIDNYIDETSLTHLAKKQERVEVLLLTKNNSKQVMLDVQKANEQYGHFVLKYFSQSHDRFLIIDKQHVYHLGASLKDIGKKWFAFSKLNKQSVDSIMQAIAQLV